MPIPASGGLPWDAVLGPLVGVAPEGVTPDALGFGDRIGDDLREAGAGDPRTDDRESGDRVGRGAGGIRRFCVPERRHRRRL